MFKTALFLLFTLTLISASTPSLNPTPVQQFVVIPSEYDFNVKLWHIKNDIIGLYGFSALDQGYLKLSPESGDIKRILNDTTSSCHTNGPLLDQSYYYSAASTLLFYCANNNSLLTISTDTYTVQDAIPVSSSRIFQEVLLGHNQQGLVYILGLPTLLAVPANAPTELILVNLTTKAVENHVIFNKGSDSQLLVTGYAFDSSASYVLTKGLESGKTLVKINKIALKENDYELIQFANFTYEKEDLVHFTHNPLDIINGYFFTNDKENLLIFNPDGNLYLNQTRLFTDPRGNSAPGTLWTPTTAARIGGSTFYAFFFGFQAFAFSLQNGVMNSTLLDPKTYEMKIALGDTNTEKDLLINFGVDLFFIKEISTNTTIYTSLTGHYSDLFYSKSYYFALAFEALHIFDLQKSGKFIKTLETKYAYHDKASNTLLNLVEEGSFCRVTYIDLDTLAVSQGPLILNKNACSYDVIYVNITDRANPFFIIENKGGKYLFVSPETYGLAGTISWTFIYDVWATGTIIPGDAGKSFTLVYADTKNKTKDIQIVTYKLNKLLRRFDSQDSYQMASIQAASSSFSLRPLISQNKVLMSSYDKKITILDLKLNTTVTYDVPAYYDSGVGVFYDKSKTPYVALSEIVNFGYSTTLPQLFDFTKVIPMPATVENVSISAVVTGDCSYYVFDKYYNVAVVRFYDTCSAAQTQKISI